ncbi:MAG: hypothetical protein FCKEOINB_00565 [Nitrosomonas sp.]|nr:hypothetical protein [Nitrosomonas sp.]
MVQLYREANPFRFILTATKIEGVLLAGNHLKLAIESNS